MQARLLDGETVPPAIIAHIGRFLPGLYGRPQGGYFFGKFRGMLAIMTKMRRRDARLSSCCIAKNAVANGALHL
jgi:hypothetical protein